ncbi:hypothetical protein MHU86_8234 [Fragilaria crotonensis]|nr:hypothetical protein MHU86_8234 [Fragilaria crotonensis]
MDSSGESLVFKDTENPSDEWEHAKVVLQANPSLMTPQILHLALRNQPPLEVVEFMLSVNVRAASLPKRGPTALQCAVRYHASIDVVKCLLMACPFALLASNLDDTQFKNPLECARATRADETELIEMLSQPLSFCDNADADRSKVVAAKIALSRERRKETLKVHRRTPQLLTTDFLLDIDQTPRDDDKKEFTVVDKKDKVMQYKNRDMEHRVSKAAYGESANRSEIDARKEVALMKLEASAEEFDALVKDWKAKAERRIRRLEYMMKQESKMNEFHRKDTRLQLDCIEQTVNEAHSAEPLVFGPTLFSCINGDVDESEEPLFGKHPTQLERRRSFWSPSTRRMKPSARMRNN